MKTKLLTICILIILSGCSEQQTVNYSDTYEKDGVIYLKFSEPTPYTGNVTGEKKGFIKNGKKHHEFLKFYTSGELLTRINYKNGLRHGEHLRYCKNGDIQNEEYFENDFPVGTHNYFRCESNKYFNGKHHKRQSIKYYKEKDTYQREFFYAFKKDYDVNGQMSNSYLYKSNSKQYTLNSYKADWKLLEWKKYEYHSNGKISYECSIAEGIRSGICKWFWENGNLKILGEYKINRIVYPNKEMKHGTFIWYDKDGNESKKKYYTDDKLTTSPPPCEGFCL